MPERGEISISTAGNWYCLWRNDSRTQRLIRLRRFARRKTFLLMLMPSLGWPRLLRFASSRKPDLRISKVAERRNPLKTHFSEMRWPRSNRNWP